MATKKQIEANRRNAKKSTGPKTEEGKAKSSMNALKHGLTSQKVWLNEEEERDFKSFRLGLLDELEPIGSLETQFVCRIAAQMWRLARVPGIEAELLEKMSYDMAEGYTSLGEAFHRDCGTYDGSLGRLARYEAILDRGLDRLLNQYRKIQADRIKREKRRAEEWERGESIPYDTGGRYPGPEDDTAGLPREYVEKFKANRGNVNAGEIAEDTIAEEPTAVRTSQGAGPRKQRGRRGNGGGNGIDRAPAGRGIPHPDGWEPTLGS